MKKVKLDQSTCIGCGLCASLSDAFEVIDGVSNVVKEFVNDDDTGVNDAISRCPVGCIGVEDAEDIC